MHRDEAPRDSDDAAPAGEEPSGDAEAALEAEAPPEEELPKEARTLGAVHEPQRLHPLTLLHRFVGSLPALAFIFYPVIVSPGNGNALTLFFALAYGLFALPAIVLRYWRFSYRITPKQIVIQQGVFNRQQRSIPIERVQNVQINRPFLARLFGTARVQIETAGSSATEGKLEYVTAGEAERIREVIRSFQREQVDAAEASESEDEAMPAADTRAKAEPETEDLFDMSLGRVLLSGAFRFSLVYIALIFSLLQFFQPEDIVRWLDLSQGDLEGLWRLFEESPLFVGAVSVAVAVLVGWLTGIIINLTRYYGFRLWLEGDKLRKKQGLFNLTEGTIPLAKVQALVIRTNPLMRAFGWYTLQVQTVGTDVDEEGHRVVVPFAQWDTMLPLAKRIRAFDLPETFARVSPLTIRRRTIRFTLAFAAVVAPAVYLWPADWWHPSGVALPWWVAGLWPLLPALAWAQYRQHGYALQDDGFYVRRGVFSHHIWILPTEKHHVFYETAWIFQRRLELRSLFVDTAGASASAFPDVVDLPAETAHDLTRRLDAQFKRLYAERVEAATGDPDARLAPDERPALPDDPLGYAAA